MDYESVGKDGFEGIENVNVNDKIVIFYNECTDDTISFSLLKKFVSCPAEIKMVSRNHNTTDKGILVYAKIISHISYIAGASLESELYLISIDSEIGDIFNTLEDTNLYIRICRDIEQALAIDEEDDEENGYYDGVLPW